MHSWLTFSPYMVYRGFKILVKSLNLFILLFSLVNYYILWLWEKNLVNPFYCKKNIVH